MTCAGERSRNISDFVLVATLTDLTCGVFLRTLQLNLRVLLKKWQEDLHNLMSLLKESHIGHAQDVVFLLQTNSRFTLFFKNSENTLHLIFSTNYC